MNETTPAAPAWQDAIFDALKAACIRQVAYVPDAGHSHLRAAMRSQSQAKIAPPTNASKNAHTRPITLPSGLIE